MQVVEHDVSANSKKARKSRKEGPAGTASDGHDGHPALPEGMLEPGHMLMFHISEISRPHGAPPPSPGETYDCNIVTNIRTNEVSARRLAKHSDAPEGFVPPEVPPEMAQAATRPAMRPLFARRMADSSARSDSPGGARDSTGERIALPRPARIAKGPDGTRGFTMGRGKAPSKLVLSALASSFVPASVAPGSRGSMAEAGRESTASEIGGRGDGEGEKKEDGERKEGEKEEGEKAEEKEKGVKEEKEEKVQEGEEDKAE